MSSASTRRAVERSASSRCFTPGSHVDAGGDVKRERQRLVREVGLLGLDIVELAQEGASSR